MRLLILAALSLTLSACHGGGNLAALSSAAAAYQPVPAYSTGIYIPPPRPYQPVLPRQTYCSTVAPGVMHCSSY